MKTQQEKEQLADEEADAVMQANYQLYRSHILAEEAYKKQYKATMERLNKES